MNGPKILHVTSDGMSEYNSARWRVSNSATALIKAGYDVKIIPVMDWMRRTDVAKLACAWADIIFIHRVLVPESTEFARYWIQKGKAVVAAFDDHYEAVTKTNPAYRYWIEGKATVNTSAGSFDTFLSEHPLDQFKVALRQLTAGETPSRKLTKRWSEFTPMFYIPNYIDAWRYLQANKVQNDYITIGYGSSLGHNESYANSGVKEALNRICREYSNVRFLLIGDKRIGDIVGLPSDKLAFQQYVPYNLWHTCLARYDIGIAPLGNEFDTGRSPIKCIEYTVMGIPFVATGDDQCRVYEDFYDVSSGSFVPYGEDTGTNAYYERAEKWYQSLKQMIDNIASYRQLANESREYGLQFDVDRNVNNIVQVYEDILKLV